MTNLCMNILPIAYLLVVALFQPGIVTCGDKKKSPKILDNTD